MSYINRMTTTLSSKGQIVLPRNVRARLRLGSGSKFECTVVEDSIILKPILSRPIKAERVIDEVSGLMVTKRTKTETVTSDTIKAFLADFP